MSLQLSVNDPQPAATNRKPTEGPSLTHQIIWFGSVMSIRGDCWPSAGWTWRIRGDTLGLSMFQLQPVHRLPLIVQNGSQLLYVVMKLFNCAASLKHQKRLESDDTDHQLFIFFQLPSGCVQLLQHFLRDHQQHFLIQFLLFLLTWRVRWFVTQNHRLSKTTWQVTKHLSITDLHQPIRSTNTHQQLPVVSHWMLMDHKDTNA